MATGEANVMLRTANPIPNVTLSAFESRRPSSVSSLKFARQPIRSFRAIPLLLDRAVTSPPRACQTATRISAPWVCVALQANVGPRHAQTLLPRKSLNREVGDWAIGRLGNWAVWQLGKGKAQVLESRRTVPVVPSCRVARLPNCRLSACLASLRKNRNVFWDYRSLRSRRQKHADAVGLLDRQLG
jgi:hypothetical protein